MAVEGKILCS